jgi:hypothetical protein
MEQTQASAVKTYTRVVTTADGGSAFEDAEMQLSTQHVSDDVPPMFVGGLGAAPGVAFVVMTDLNEPHPASDPQWVVMLRGVIEVEVSDGTCRRFGPGELVFATDTTGRGHITRTVGDGPHEALGVVVAPANSSPAN